MSLGLSRSGKTALSADATRILTGDGEYDCNNLGVFNFEGGYHAKVVICLGKPNRGFMPTALLTAGV